MSRGEPPSKTDQLVNKNDIIFQVGIIALEFARLENALDHCLFSIAQESGASPKVRKANPTDPFVRKLGLLREWGPWYVRTCEVRSPLSDLKRFLDECEKLAHRRNQYVHAMALYYIEDFESEDSTKFAFLWKKERREFFGDWVEATPETLAQMQDLQRQITSASDLMQDLSMSFSHAENRIREYEEALGLLRRDELG